MRISACMYVRTYACMQGALYPEVASGSITLRGWGVVTHVMTLMWILLNLISRMLPWPMRAALQCLVRLSGDHPRQAMAAALTQLVTADIEAHLPYLLGENKDLQAEAADYHTHIASRRTSLWLLDAQHIMWWIG